MGITINRHGATAPGPPRLASIFERLDLRPLLVAQRREDGRFSRANRVHAAEITGYTAAKMLDHRGRVSGQMASISSSPQYRLVGGGAVHAPIPHCFVTGSAAVFIPVSETGPYRVTPATISETPGNEGRMEISSAAVTAADQTIRQSCRPETCVCRAVSSPSVRAFSVPWP